MKKIILLRYAEIHLKGNNRSFFESVLITNIKKALSGISFQFVKNHGRYQISDFDESLTNNIIEKMKCIFGIHSMSECYVVETSISAIAEAALSLGVEKGTFRVSCNRADKTFQMKSFEVAAEIGSIMLNKYPKLSVDLHEPQHEVFVDIRENKYTFVYSKNISCSGGLPVGCSGRGMLLLSGGIDSPVAGYCMAKRGMSITAIHFHSFPFTSIEAKEKVIKLASILTKYTSELTVLVVPFTEIQKQIHEKCPEEYMITIMRRFMMRIGERLSKEYSTGALITGESLGQVASQTLESITVTNDTVDLPVFRPLIGMDKSEIIELSKKIGTYETSILPYEDCCTVFLPKNPIIKPKISLTEKFESALDINMLIDNAIENIEVIKI